MIKYTNFTAVAVLKKFKLNNYNSPRHQNINEQFIYNKLIGDHDPLQLRI